MINECVQGGIADTLTTTFYVLQTRCWLQYAFGGRGVPSPSVWGGDEMLAAIRFWGRGVPSPSGWLQMRCYLQPYLQPYNMLGINMLWRYLGLGCRWQMKMKTIF